MRSLTPKSTTDALPGFQVESPDIHTRRANRRLFIATALSDWQRLGDVLVEIAEKPSDLDSELTMLHLAAEIGTALELAEQLRPLSLRLRE